MTLEEWNNLKQGDYIKRNGKKSKWRMIMHVPKKGIVMLNSIQKDRRLICYYSDERKNFEKIW